jgi:nicotinamidase-related amidase
MATKSSGVWKYEDVALVLIDYQKEMFETVRSETPAEMIDLNVRLLIKAAKAFGVPIVLSSVGVEMGVNHPTRQSILDELPGIKVIDRSSMNAWEDKPFVEAVKKTGRKRIIFGALYTEICLAYPVVDAMAEGYGSRGAAHCPGGRRIGSSLTYRRI